MTGRMRRVNEAIRETLAEAVGELKDPRIGFVTVTGVETSPDLRQAKVFVYNRQNSVPDVEQLERKAQAEGIPVVAITETLDPLQVLPAP